MTDSKRLFVKQFLAALFNEGIGTIPINNALFQSGMENMAQYFKAHERDGQLFSPWRRACLGEVGRKQNVVL